MGMTENKSEIQPLFQIVERAGLPVSTLDGAVSDDGNIAGTYIHGMFESYGFRRYFLNQIRKAKKWEPFNGRIDSWNRSAQFDHLAGMIRQHLKVSLDTFVLRG